MTSARPSPIGTESFGIATPGKESDDQLEEPSRPESLSDMQSPADIPELTDDTIPSPARAPATVRHVDDDNDREARAITKSMEWDNGDVSVEAREAMTYLRRGQPMPMDRISQDGQTLSWTMRRRGS